MIGRQTRQTRGSSPISKAHPLKIDFPDFSADWGQALDYAMLDSIIKDTQSEQAAIREAYEKVLGLPKGSRPIAVHTDIWWAKTILRAMIAEEKAPAKANMSWNCIETICNSDWILERILQHGIEVNRYEVQRRRK